MSNNYLEAASGLTQGLNSLVTSLTLGKFIRWIFVLLLITAISLYFYENYFTQNFFYEKIERKIEIIAKIH